MYNCRSTLAILLLGALLLTGCAGAEPAATPVPAYVEPTMPPAQGILGDTWTRPSDDMVMVAVPGGTFPMGSSQEEIDAALEMCQRNSGSGKCLRGWFENESPQHMVTVDTYWIDRTEVTKAQYRRCVESGHCDAVDCESDFDPKRDDQPVACVDWSHAQGYCEWAGARLPTEAEWEYAARGPEGKLFPWGDSFDPARLNYCDANCTYEWRDAGHDDGYNRTAPVGSYESGASWCGALDMAGNIWEWVQDWWAEDYYARSPAANPQGPETGTLRVARGASWFDEPYKDVSFRAPLTPSSYRMHWVGIRCAMPAGQ